MSQNLAFDRRDVAARAGAERDQAEKLEKRAKDWRDWFPGFEAATGPICDKFNQACREFFEREEQCLTALAAEHRRCADTLDGFNGAMQCADEDRASNIATFSGDSFRGFLDRHGVRQPGVETS